MRGEPRDTYVGKKKSGFCFLIFFIKPFQLKGFSEQHEVL